MDKENVIKGLNDIGGFIAGRVGFEQARNFLRTIDDAIVLLKEQNGLMLALEQSNAVNGYLNAEVERLNGLRKEQDPVETELEGGGSSWWYVCGECHGAIDQRDNYCKHCGRRIRHEKKAE